MAADAPTVRVIGLGNAFRGDDAVGLDVARAVRTRVPGIDCVAGLSDGTALLELWDNTDLCIVVDCAVSGAEPGTVHRFEALSQHIPEGLFSSYSTHAISIPRAIELGRVLNRLPQQLIVYAIEGDRFTCGAGVGDRVHEASKSMIDCLVAEIERFQRSNGLAVE